MNTRIAQPNQAKLSSHRVLGKHNAGTSNVQKVEGFDQGQGRNDTFARKSALSASRASAKTINRQFDRNLETLKTNSVHHVEDEYIKALQEEIKILEYQLKILKDKEMEQQAAVS